MHDNGHKDDANIKLRIRIKTQMTESITAVIVPLNLTFHWLATAAAMQSHNYFFMCQGEASRCLTLHAETEIFTLLPIYECHGYITKVSVVV